MKARALLVPFVALATLGGAFLVHRARTESTGVPEAAQDLLAVRWPAGREVTYAFEFERQQETALFGAAQRAELTLAGTLRLRSHGVVGGRTRLALALPELERHTFTRLGQDALPGGPDAAARLQAGEAFVELDARGAVAGIAFPADADPAFCHLARGLATELQLVLDPREPAWEVEEATALGRAISRYEVRRRTPAEADVARAREDWVRLDAAPPGVVVASRETEGEVVFTIDRKLGVVRRAAGSESVHAFDRKGESVVEAETTLELTLLKVGTFDVDPAALVLSADLPLSVPDVPDVSPEMERRLLESRVDGLTMESLVDDLLDLGPGGRMNDHNRWLWRATGLLTLRPELCDQFDALFQDPYLNHTVRAMILDLLTNVGHAQAQAALRRLLATDAARQGPGAAALYQRLALLDAPDAATLDLAESRFDTDEGPSRGPAAVVLGAVAGQRHRSGDLEGARRANEKLVSALRAAGEPGERAALVLGLGNAGLEENVATLRALAEDEDSGVRGAVATALRKTATPEAEALLLDLLTDADPQVQLDASESLARQSVSDLTLRAVEARAASGAIALDAVPGVVTFLSAHLESEPGRAALRALLARDGLDPVMQQRIRGLLDG